MVLAVTLLHFIPSALVFRDGELIGVGSRKNTDLVEHVLSKTTEVVTVVLLQQVVTHAADVVITV